MCAHPTTDTLTRVGEPEAADPALPEPCPVGEQELHDPGQTARRRHDQWREALGIGRVDTGSEPQQLGSCGRNSLSLFTFWLYFADPFSSALSEQLYLSTSYPSFLLVKCFVLTSEIIHLVICLWCFTSHHLYCLLKQWSNLDFFKEFYYFLYFFTLMLLLQLSDLGNYHHTLSYVTLTKTFYVFKHERFI